MDLFWDIHHVFFICGTMFHATVKILKIGTPEIITIIVLQLEQLDFTVQYCQGSYRREKTKFPNISLTFP